MIEYVGMLGKLKLFNNGWRKRCEEIIKIISPPRKKTGLKRGIIQVI